MALTIIADITTKPDQVEMVKAELDKLLPITRGEAGCIDYNYHQDNNNEAHFIFYENWESRDLWQQHMNAPHMVGYAEVTKEAVLDWTLIEATKQS